MSIFRSRTEPEAEPTTVRDDQTTDTDRVEHDPDGIGDSSSHADMPAVPDERADHDTAGERPIADGDRDDDTQADIQDDTRDSWRGDSGDNRRDDEGSDAVTQSSSPGPAAAAPADGDTNGSTASMDSTGSMGSTGSAASTDSTGSMGSTGSAASMDSTGSAGSTGSAEGAGSTGSVGSAGATPADSSSGTATPAENATIAAGQTVPERLVSQERADAYSTRWQSVKSGFVDEPRDAVGQADALVGELLDELQELFSEQRRRLEDGLDADTTSTEDLRLALRRYRSFFDRLVSF